MNKITQGESSINKSDAIAAGGCVAATGEQRIVAVPAAIGIWEGCFKPGLTRRASKL